MQQLELTIVALEEKEVGQNQKLNLTRHDGIFADDGIVKRREKKRIYVRNWRIKNRQKVIEYSRNYGSKERVRQRAKERKLNRRYCITSQQYNDLVEFQNGRCAICEEIPVKPLVVDHCHKSKGVRGLLCIKCNWLLGSARDNRDILQSAINYLSTHV